MLVSGAGVPMCMVGYLLLLRLWKIFSLVGKLFWLIPITEYENTVGNSVGSLSVYLSVH